MRTFRLLLWLRWRLAMNTTSRRGRWGAIALTVLLALAFAPLYLGAAALSYSLGAREGAPALLLVFGVAQVGIVWMSLVAGALGRTFEPDKLKRYPFRPLEVQAFNLLASLTEPIVVMTVPSLLAVTLGVWQHAGAWSGLRAAAGALLLLLGTASILQLLLAVLDDFLRREWMRYVAAMLLTGTILFVQLAIGRSSRRLSEQAQKAGFSPEGLLAELRHVFEGVPSVAAPASLGGAPVDGPLAEPVFAALVSAVLLIVPLLWAARVMSRAVQRETPAGRTSSRGGRAANGTFALRWPGFTRPQQLLLAREWHYLMRTPALLYQMAVIPLTVVVIGVVGRTSDPTHEWMLPAAVMTSSLSARNLALWAHDGPGIRMLILLPFTSRDLVLSKNAGWLLSTFAEAALTLALITALRPTTYLPLLPWFAPGFAALAFAAAAVGTWVSIAHPMRMQERGFVRRSPGGVNGLLAYLAVLVMATGIVLALLGTRALTPDPYDLFASVVVASLMLACAVAVWWISLDRHAHELERNREKMIDVLARSTGS